MDANVVIHSDVGSNPTMISKIINILKKLKKMRKRELRFKTYQAFVDFYKRMKQRINTLLLEWSDVRRGFDVLTY